MRTLDRKGTELCVAEHLPAGNTRACRPEDTRPACSSQMTLFHPIRCQQERGRVKMMFMCTSEISESVHKVYFQIENTPATIYPALKLHIALKK